MNSSSTFPNTSHMFDTRRVDYPQFVVYIVVQFLLLSIEVYILAAFSQFVEMKRKKDLHQTGKSGISRKRKILIALLMSVTATGIIRAAQFLQILFLPNHSPSTALACSLNLNIFYVLYIAGLAALYIFLWFRQHTLYALPSMEKMVPRSVKKFSDFLLILIVVTGVGAAVGFILANPTEKIIFVPETQACIFPDPTESNVYFVNIAAYAMLVVFQGSLLFCFVYILRRHQTDMKKHQQGESSGVSKRPRHSLEKLIRNCVIAAAICMFTDIATLTLSFLLPSTAQLYNLLLFDMDYIINLSCAVFCFSSWKEMIDPWMLRNKLACSRNRTYDLRSRISSHPTSTENYSKSKPNARFQVKEVK